MRLHARPRLPLLATTLAASILASATLGAGLASAASTNYVSNCAVNLRATASTSGTIVATISTGATVTSTGTASGGSWSATCGGSTVSGSSWYVITAVNGTSTSTLYGKASVYGATGLFSVAPPPPPPGSWLEGIDVSHWQGAINWATVAQYKKFAIMKATESTTYADDTYATNHAGARANGMRTGAYHFAQPSTTAGDAVAEADWFVAHANLLAGDLNPALDLEVSNGLSVSALQAWVKAWLDEVYLKTGIRPMIYTSPSFWSTYMGNTTSIANAGYTVLWIAHWGVTSPTVPASNWGGKGWTFWQYTSSGSVPGISGRVDLDRYNGTDMTKVTYKADFSLGATAASASIEQGATTTASISINRTWFTLPVALSVSGAPANSTATLDTTSTPGNTATLTFKTQSGASATPVGSYKLTITGTANGLTRTASVTIAVTDSIAPTLSVPYSLLVAPAYFSSTGTLGKTAWVGSDTSGISQYAAEVQVNGGTWTAIPLASPTSTSTQMTWGFGATQRFRVQATDGVGNTTPWTYGPTFRVAMNEDTNAVNKYGGTWSTISTAAASGGTLRSTTQSGAYVTETFTGVGIAWIAYRGPTRGKARVYVDGVLLATVDLYSATAHGKAVVYAKAWTTAGTHTIKVVNLATSGRPRIDLDAFAPLVVS